MAVIPVRPTLALLFDRGDFNDQIITCSRASTAQVWSPEGGLEQVAIDVPRLDYDPVTGELVGLLTERGRANLFTHSEDLVTLLSNSGGATTTANSGVAPNGENVATLIDVSSSTARSYINMSVTGGVTYTVSYWIKKNTSSGTGGFSVSGAVVTSDENIVTLTDEWQRISLTFTPDSSGGVSIFFLRETTGTATEALIWGAQLEEGAYASSYIPTSGATASRSSDDYRITGQRFLDFMNFEEGTFVVSGYGRAPVSLSLTDDNEADPALRMGKDMIRINNSGYDFNHDDVSSYNGDFEHYKIAFAYNNSEQLMRSFRDGVKTREETDTDSFPSGVTQMKIGREYIDTHLGGREWFKRILFYPKSLTDEQCILLTKTLSL